MRRIGRMPQFLDRICMKEQLFDFGPRAIDRHHLALRKIQPVLAYPQLQTLSWAEYMGSPIFPAPALPPNGLVFGRQRPAIEPQRRHARWAEPLNLLEAGFCGCRAA